MSKDSIDTVVTGGTGLIGRWLIAALTRRGYRVAALVRSAERRGPEFAAFVDRIGGISDNLTVIDGDLDGAALEGRHDLGEVRYVYHLAARFAFGLSMEQVRPTNVGGTQRLLSWAAELPQLRRFVHVAGYRAQHMPEWLRKAPFPLSSEVLKRLYSECGAYEASKLESLLLVRYFSRTRKLPLTVVHPSSVIGDSRTGETTQLTGLGEVVEQLWRGKLLAVPGTARTNVPLISVDALAELMSTVVANAETEGQELCFLDPRTPPLVELVGLIAKHLGVKPPKRMVAISTLRRLPKFVTKTEPEALTFLTEDQYDTKSGEAHAKAMGYALPPLGKAIENWVAQLVATRFLRALSPLPALAPRFIAAATSQTFALGDPTEARVVFLHGLPWNADSWRPVAEALGQSSALVDLPGLGRSSRARPSAHSPSVATAELEWLEALFAQRKTRVILVGHSLGAGIAVEFARRAPSLVSGLVLVAPAFLQPRAGLTLRTPWLLAPVFRFGSTEFLQRQILPGGRSLDPTVVSAFESLKRPGVSMATARALAAASDPDRRRRQLDALRELSDTPVALICGERDPLSEAHKHLAAHVVKGCGHTPHVAAPIEVAEVIANFTGTQALRSDRAAHPNRDGSARSNGREEDAVSPY